MAIKIRLIKYYVKTVKSNSTAEPTIITKYPTDISKYSEFIIGTNDMESNINRIIKLYGQRWDVEVNIGILKHNFKIEHSKTYELNKFIQQILLAAFIYSYCRFMEFISVRRLKNATVIGFNVIKTKRAKKFQKINFTSHVKSFLKYSTKIFSDSKAKVKDAVELIISTSTKGLHVYRPNRHYLRSQKTIKRKNKTGKKQLNFERNEKKEERKKDKFIEWSGRLLSLGKYVDFNNAFKWKTEWFS